MIEQSNIIKKNIWYFDILFTAVHKQVGGGVPGAGINSEVKKLNKLICRPTMNNKRNQIIYMYVHFAFYCDLFAIFTSV